MTTASNFCADSDLKAPDCKNFTGYKPCAPGKVCEPDCDENPIGTKILIIKLGALGDVLMTTSLLPALKRKYPVSSIHWLTRLPAMPLLENNPYLDAVYPWDDESRMILRNMRFDLALNADKSRAAGAFMSELKAERKLGFGINENGAIVPLNAAAGYLYRLGLDDELKFRLNQKSGPQMLAEAFEVPYQRDPYVLRLSDEELALSRRYREEWRLDDADFVVGFNTGCADLYPLKKLSVEQHVAAIGRLIERLPGVRVLLLGGREDTERNRRIAAAVGERAIATPTTLGLRKGICFVYLCDVVVSGDTLGMHIAIALGKYVIAWFGLTCAQEIDLYDRGIKIVRDLPCSPCWKQMCDMPYGPICVTEFDLDEIVEAVAGYAAKRSAVPMMPEAVK